MIPFKVKLYEDFKLNEDEVDIVISIADDFADKAEDISKECGEEAEKLGLDVMRWDDAEELPNRKNISVYGGENAIDDFIDYLEDRNDLHIVPRAD